MSNYSGTEDVGSGGALESLGGALGLAFSGICYTSAFEKFINDPFIISPPLKRFGHFAHSARAYAEEHKQEVGVTVNMPMAGAVGP